MAGTHNRRTVKEKITVIGLCLFVLSVFLLKAAVPVTGEDEDEFWTGAGKHNGTVAVDPIGKSDGFSAVLYNNTNGLPTSEANDIVETSGGFI